LLLSLPVFPPSTPSKTPGCPILRSLIAKGGITKSNQSQPPAVAFALAFLVVIPEGDLLSPSRLPVFPNPPRTNGCPILRVFCEGWDELLFVRHKAIAVVVAFQLSSFAAGGGSASVFASKVAQGFSLGSLSPRHKSGALAAEVRFLFDPFSGLGGLVKYRYTQAILLILLPLLLSQFLFCHFLPKNRMSSPETI
jgi:hypothetical protein